MWYSDKVYLVQRDLVFLTFNPEPYHTKLDTACCIAASIFVNIRLRDLGMYSSVIGFMVKNLKEFLENGCLENSRSDESNSQEEMCKLFWILVYGAISAVGRLEREWFVESLRSVCGRMEIKSQNDGVEILKRILWSHEWDGHYQSLMKDFVLNRGS